MSKQWCEKSDRHHLDKMERFGCHNFDLMSDYLDNEVVLFKEG